MDKDHKGWSSAGESKPITITTVIIYYRCGCTVSRSRSYDQRLEELPHRCVTHHQTIAKREVITDYHLPGCRAELEAAQDCICTFCCRRFGVSTIEEWTDHGNTALCPFCHIDRVYVDTSHSDTMERLRRFWHSG